MIEFGALRCRSQSIALGNRLARARANQRFVAVAFSNTTRYFIVANPYYFRLRSHSTIGGPQETSTLGNSPNFSRARFTVIHNAVVSPDFPAGCVAAVTL